MKRLVKKAGLWLAVGLGLWTAHAGAGAEPSFLQKDPEMKARLLQWEREAPEEVKAEIDILRTRDALAKAPSCDRLGKMGPQAKGAILALIETFTDRTEVEWTRPDGRKHTTTPSYHAELALEKIGDPGRRAPHRRAEASR